MSYKSNINSSAGYTNGYVQMILGEKRKTLKAKRKRERQNRKNGRK